MKYFANCATLDELKKEYRRLSMIHHPDMGGNEETMKAINNEYSQMFELLKTAQNASADDYHKTTEAPEEFIEIINHLVKMSGLIVELCGSWLWISGETMKNKEALKAAGCRWSSNKKMWYWHHVEDGAKWSRGKRSMSEIRSKYGSQVFQGGRETTGYATIGAAG